MKCIGRENVKDSGENTQEQYGSTHLWFYAIFQWLLLSHTFLNKSVNSSYSTGNRSTLSGPNSAGSSGVASPKSAAFTITKLVAANISKQIKIKKRPPQKLNLKQEVNWSGRTSWLIWWHLLCSIFILRARTKPLQKKEGGCFLRIKHNKHGGSSITINKQIRL